MKYHKIYHYNKSKNYIHPKTLIKLIRDEVWQNSQLKQINEFYLFQDEVWQNSQLKQINEFYLFQNIDHMIK